MSHTDESCHSEVEARTEAGLGREQLRILPEKKDASATPRLQGRFELALQGFDTDEPVSRLSEDQVRWETSAQQALLANLKAGQALEFCYGWAERASGQAGFFWRIAAHCLGTGRTEVTEQARLLYQSLKMNFCAGERGLRFEPESWAEPVAEEMLAWQCGVSRAGVAVSIPRSSYSGRPGIVTLKHRVIMPLFLQNQGAPNFDSVVRAGLAGAGPFTVCVRVEPVRLSPEAADLLDVAYNHRKFGTRGSLRELRGGRSFKLRSSSLEESTLQLLRQWSIEARGFHVRCAINARVPLPDSIIGMIGSELFSHYPVDISQDLRATRADEIEDAGEVRLHNCNLPGTAPLQLIPSAQALQSAGLRKS